MIYVFADPVSAGPWALYTRQYLHAFRLSGVEVRACWFGVYGPQPEILPEEDHPLLSLGSVCPAPSQCVVRIGPASEVISQGMAVGQRGPRNIAITRAEKGRCDALRELFDEVWVGSEGEAGLLRAAEVEAVQVLPPPVPEQLWGAAPVSVQGQCLALGPWAEVEPALDVFLRGRLSGEEEPGATLVMACDDSPFPGVSLDVYLARWRWERGLSEDFPYRPKLSLVARPTTVAGFARLMERTDRWIYCGTEQLPELGWYAAVGGRRVEWAGSREVEPDVDVRTAARLIGCWLGALPPSPYVW